MCTLALKHLLLFSPHLLLFSPHLLLFSPTEPLHDLVIRLWGSNGTKDNVIVLYICVGTVPHCVCCVLLLLCCFQLYNCILYIICTHLCVFTFESQTILAVVVKTGPEWLTETSWDCLHVVSQPGPIYTTPTVDDGLGSVHWR